MDRHNAPDRRTAVGDDSGAVAVLMGVLLTVLVAFVGLGVEVGLWWFEKSKAQSAADAAAYAGGYEMMRLQVGSTLDTDEKNAIETEGLNAAADHGYTSNVTVTPDAGADTVTAVVTNPVQPLLLGMILAQDSIDIAARAVVLAKRVGKDVCILSLKEDGSPGVDNNGNSKVTLTGCGIHSNSTTGDSICANGSGWVKTDAEYSASGTFCKSGKEEKYQDENGDAKDVQENQPKLMDPYGNVQANAPGSCDTSSGLKVKDTNDLQDGNYYCGGLTFQDAVSLNSGTYYVKGEVRFNSKADVSGSGVTFVLMEGATVTVNAQASIDLTAPNSGDFSGLLFFQDPETAGSPGVSIFNGGANVHFNGALYFPKSKIRLNGNFSSTPSCMQLIAGEIELKGTQDLTIDWSKCGGGVKKPYVQTLALIE